MKDELIRKLKELVDNTKEIGRFYISCKNGVATKSDVEKMKMLCKKGETLEEEIAALEKQIADVRNYRTTEIDEANEQRSTSLIILKNIEKEEIQQLINKYTPSKWWQFWK